MLLSRDMMQSSSRSSEIRTLCCQQEPKPGKVMFKHWTSSLLVLGQSFCSTDTPSSSALQRPLPHEYDILLPEAW
ncbi:hypothetical protein AOXY_G7067 [Acipenser oxyrinchus oxyrinchus]|uniref:Uncharacterized protein n=1 Tax=Acipenser oxyrinchus oxyrinchus TaxID=40147 RepID=A0AAD8LMH0_ACIOX|nr:hypothetical protein AOXY_G7067 [Acipenser oxyrinchus oxyrinchus]